MEKPFIPCGLLFEFAVDIFRLPSSSTKAKSRSVRRPAKEKLAASKARKSDDATSDGSSIPWRLDERYELPPLHRLAGTQDHSRMAIAWSEEGLAIECRVRGKSSALPTPQRESGAVDRLSFWLDTRNSIGVQRGNRFCHLFHFQPGSSGKPTAAGTTHPGYASTEPLPRTREHPNPIDVSLLRVQTDYEEDGYRLRCFLPAACMTGYSPLEFDHIRFYWDVLDAQRGTQSQVLDPNLGYPENPSLWVEAALVDRDPE